MKGRKLTALLVLGALGAPQLFAWKSSFLPTNAWKSPHGRLTGHALDLIRERAPGEREWIDFRDLIVRSAGQVMNDANSHGNVILDIKERVTDPAEGTKEEDELLEDPVTYNSGPFYRFWVRMHESAAHLNMGIPQRDASVASQRVWRRFPDRDFAADAVYRYLGYMAHLAEDNAVPAHAANVRHGDYEGLEYWTWGTRFLGGYGKSDLTDTELNDVRNRMNDKRLWNLPDFRVCKQSELVNTAKKDEFEDRGHDKAQSATQIEGVLSRFIKDSRKNTQMPEFEKDERIFKRVKGGGRRPNTEGDIQKIWQYELDLSQSLFGDSNGSYEAQLQAKIYSVPQPQYTNNKDVVFKTLWDSNLNLPGLSVQWWFLDGNPNGGQPLNDGRAPYLPNPNYAGKAFDTQWGSYGGYFGFPGRHPVEMSTITGYIDDAVFSRAAGQIHPGDLYMYHRTPAEYNAREARILDNSGMEGYPLSPQFWDDRANMPFEANPAFKSLSELAMKDAVAWAATTMSGLSAAIPPVVTHFDVKPLSRDAKPVGDSSWRVSRRGANLELAFQSSRNADFQVEFYAIPADRIVAEPSRGRIAGFSGAYLNFTRTLTLNSGITLWKSDIGVEDLGGATELTGGKPGMPVNYGQAPNYRDYDYVYAELPLIPLEVTADISGSGGWAATLPSKGLPLKGVLAPASTKMFDPSTGTWIEGVNLSYQTAVQTFKWKGFVGDSPVTLMGDPYPLPEGTKRFEHLIPDGNGKFLLRSGAYFILAVLYREGSREIVAFNQFKLMSSAKENLEKTSWWKEEPAAVYPKWQDALANKAPAALLNPSQRFMIPDELVPILVDSDPPSARTD